jgi:hypothetical protein
VSSLVAVLLLSRRIISRERAELRSTPAAHARRIALQVQIGVLTAVKPLQRLGQWWLTQEKPEDPEDWATDGQLFLSQSPGLRAAIWVDTVGRQRWSAVPGATPSISTTRPSDMVLPQIARLKGRTADCHL